MLEAGLIDIAVVGGVDTLCLTTLYGFASLQLLSARALPTLRRRPRRHLDRRGGGVLPARAYDVARRIDRAARRRGIERCASHVGAASRRTGRATRDGAGARGSGPRTRSDRLREPARHGDAEQRRRRGRRRARPFRRFGAGEFDQGHDRSHAGRRGGASKRCSQCSPSRKGASRAARARVSSIRSFEHATRCGARCAMCTGPQQLVRLRRLQLQPRLRARRRPMTLAARVEGIGLVGPGLAGWPQARDVLCGRARYERTPNVHPFAGRASRRRAPPRGKGGAAFRSRLASRRPLLPGAPRATWVPCSRRPRATARTCTRSARCSRRTIA